MLTSICRYSANSLGAAHVSYWAKTDEVGSNNCNPVNRQKSAEDFGNESILFMVFFAAPQNVHYSLAASHDFADIYQ